MVETVSGYQFRQHRYRLSLHSRKSYCGRCVCASMPRCPKNCMHVRTPEVCLRFDSSPLLPVYPEDEALLHCLTESLSMPRVDKLRPLSTRVDKQERARF